MTPSKEQVEEAKLAAAEKVGIEKAAALRQARRDALEEAAKKADALASHWHECTARGDEAVAAERCAIAIRKLLEEPHYRLGMAVGRGYGN